MFYFADIPLVSLTATASPSTREAIIEDLSMHNCTFVIEDANRINIRYSLLNCNKSIEDTFKWLVEQLKEQGTATPRVIIFCQTKKHCCLLYSFFKKELGDDAYSVTPESPMKDDRTCLFGMYHLSTRTNQKLSAEKSFQDANGVMRVLFATSSFGTGVDVKGCHTSIHYGSPVSVEEYLQQSGRIGRDGAPSHSLILRIKRNSVPLDEAMSNYLHNDSICRRKFILGVISNPYTPLEINHTCCDLCAEQCKCKCACLQDPCTCEDACQRSHSTLQSYAEKKILERCIDLSKRKIFKVCETDRQTFAQSLLHFKESLLTEEEKRQAPLQEDFITGFSYYLIKLLCEDMEYIEDLPYLLENFPFFDSSHAKHVYSLLLSMDLEHIEGFSADIAYPSSDDYTSSSDEQYTKPNIGDSDSDTE